ncbi:PRC and DUF2382 domain-containing protein [Streptacidiphilus cavernicola]|uniref:DUF2382 domain-containing protein n=1 Tax=Streptacidiphilus cavernicola TaxID=3342716 RepID=A0ABV6W4Q3_9ACTN
MQTDIDPRDLIGHKAVDRNGDKIGTVDEVYLDDASGRPEWAAVRTGLFGRDAFVPLTSSEFVSDELRVPYDKSQVKDSPDFGVGQHLSPEQELQLYRYYGLDVPEGNGKSGAGEAAAKGSPAAAAPGSAAAATGTAGAAAPAAAAAAVAATASGTDGRTPIAPPAPARTQPAEAVGRPAPAAADTSRTAAFMASPSSAQSAPAEPTPSLAKAAPRPDPLTDPLTDPLSDPLPRAAAQSADTGSTGESLGDLSRTAVPEPIEFVCREERLDVSTEWRVLGRARLRKYVTAEQVERRVPVIRERIRVERVPVGAEERAQLTEQEIAESTEEVTLHEQRVVVRKAIVPVERIRLVTERVTEEEIVRDELHREHIQVLDNTRPTGPTPVPGTGQPTAAGQSPQSPQSQPGSSTGSAPSVPSSTPPGRPDLPGHAIGA